MSQENAPLLACFAQLLQTGILLSTTRKGSPLRLISLASIVATTYWQVFILPLADENIVEKAFIGIYLFIINIHSINLLFILNLDWEDLSREVVTRNPQPANFPSVFFMAMKLQLELRAIGTRWEATKHTPPFPAYFGPPGRSPPTRGAFMLRQAALLAWQYLLLDLVFSQSGQGVAGDADRGLWNFKSLFLNPADHRCYVRLISSLGIWLVFGRAIVDVIYRSASLVTVALHVMAPEEWPPYFGSMWEAYSLRNSWGRFWHQQFRWPFTTFSSFITRTVLRLPHPSPVERYVNVFTVFFLSGLMHHLGSPGMGSPGEKSGAIPFFTVFALGLMIEDAIQGVWRSLTGEKKHSPVAWWKKALGFLWVSAWLALVAPWYTMDITRVFARRETVLPGSIVARYGVPMASAVLVIGAVVLKVVFKTSL